MDRKTIGIISLVGPVINVAAAAVSAVIYLALLAAGVGVKISGFDPITQAILINLWLGAFNMIPFFILDWQKVLTWNRAVCAIVSITLWAVSGVAVVSLSCLCTPILRT